MDKNKLREIDKWMDFIYDVNNTMDGYKLVNKDNVHELFTIFHPSGVRRNCRGWNVTNEIRNKIVHNYE